MYIKLTKPAKKIPYVIVCVYNLQKDGQSWGTRVLHLIRSLTSWYHTRSRIWTSPSSRVHHIHRKTLQESWAEREKGKGSKQVDGRKDAWKISTVRNYNSNNTYGEQVISLAVHFYQSTVHFHNLTTMISLLTRNK